jgi:hypothetical protein
MTTFADFIIMNPAKIPRAINQTIDFRERKVPFLLLPLFIYPEKIQLKLAKVNCLSDFKVKE